MHSHSNRYIWIDIAKTIAIILVVFGHVWRGMFEAKLIQQEVFNLIDNSVYYFHMPLFFMISGFLFQKIYKRNWKTFIERSWFFIIWPYIFWSTVVVLTKSIFSSSVNTEANINALFYIAYEPISIFWFFYVLFLMQFFVKLHVENYNSVISLFLFSVGLFIISHAFNINDLEIIEKIGKYMIFFVIGFCFSRIEIQKKIRINMYTLLFCTLLFLIIQIELHFFDIDQENLFSLVAGAFLAICVILICICAEKYSLSNSAFFLKMSLGTLVIYVSHVIFTAGIRIILIKFGITNVSTHIIMGTVFGIICPLILYEITSKIGINAWVGLGKNKKP